jgi:DNA-binding transcriptional ArsR family regulator
MVEERSVVDQLSRVFAALGDPTRRDIVARLTQGEATVSELAEPYDMSLQAVSKHLKVLEDAGVVSRGATHSDVRSVSRPRCST